MSAVGDSDFANEALEAWLAREDDPKRHFLLAVSGGVDSMVMLHALSQHPTRQALLSVASIDHGLRREAQDEVELVRRFCDKHALPWVTRRIQIDPNSNLMAAARTARYAALRDIKNELGATHLLTAHHLNDLAEGLLMALRHGGHHKRLFALAESHGDLLRPLFRWSRQDIDTYAQAHQLEHAEDPSNLDPRFARSRMRRTLVPALHAEDSDFPRTLLPLWLSHREDMALLDALADEAFAKLEHDLPTGCLKHPGHLEPALAWRVLRRFLSPWVKHPHHESLTKLAKLEEGESFSLSGLDAHAQAGYLWLSLPSPTQAVTLSEDGADWPHWPGALRPTDQDLPPSPAVGYFDPARLDAGELELDAMHQGEVIEIGTNQHRKLSLLFNDHKIPSALRFRWPIVFRKRADGAPREVLWVVGLRHRALPSSGAVTIVGRKFCWSGKSLWTPRDFETH